MSKMICGCMQVDEDTIKAAIADGAETVEDIEEMTGAGSCCGRCVPAIEGILLKK
ncbi:(2Fe-2S)-binding protein [Clostridium thermobutyricum]|uniref:Bacterioferritin-associated ferredoxin n=1 Tax=Clostridium thermobutyricum DSM 4928 TaxID=1121339 RepID=A0A1V4STD1_9CLOT|nr:(2Fe-2S)-binding protein [Clostridium thermobutyricum]OPX47138.1 BFD-like [2Fe-2S] binding domain protein [Clostridium thermobutyricum DSM 4928]